MNTFRALSRGFTKMRLFATIAVAGWLGDVAGAPMAVARDKSADYFEDVGPFPDGNTCSTVGEQGAAEGRWLYDYCYQADDGWYAVVEPLQSLHKSSSDRR